MIKSPETGITIYANEVQINLDGIVPAVNYDYSVYWHTSTSMPQFPSDTRIVAVSVVSTEEDDGTFGSGCAVRLVDYNIGLTTDTDSKWKWKCLFVADGSAGPVNFWEESFDDSEWVSNSAFTL